MNIPSMAICDISAAIARGELSPAEVTRACLARINTQDGQLGAFLTVNPDAENQAAKLDSKRDSAGLLYGIPVAVKDNLCVAGLPTTCASRMLEHFVPPYHASAWHRFADSGCVLIGKTNMDEFGMGSDTTHSAFKTTCNPHDVARTAGGSSGGSAAAVADGMVPLALGSDTGGSIRQPAAFCGVVGMKPTYGRVSRYGLIAFASSLDTVGPITRTVADNALALQVLSGRDPKDATSVDCTDDVTRRLTRGVEGLRVGIPVQMMTNLSPDVAAAVRDAAAYLASAGAKVDEVQLPTLPDALPAYYIISSAEASSNLARYDGIRYGRRAAADSLDALYEKSRTEGFGDEVKRRILMGAYVLSEGCRDTVYQKALQVRTLVIRDFARAFASVDCLLGQVAPETAWRIGEKASAMACYQADIHTVPASIAGIPALSVPFGCDRNGLPIGVQLMGPAWSEGLLYQVGAVLERGNLHGVQAD